MKRKKQPKVKRGMSRREKLRQYRKKVYENFLRQLRTPGPRKKPPS